MHHGRPTGSSDQHAEGPIPTDEDDDLDAHAYEEAYHGGALEPRFVAPFHGQGSYRHSYPHESGSSSRLIGHNLSPMLPSQPPPGSSLSVSHPHHLPLPHVPVISAAADDPQPQHQPPQPIPPVKPKRKRKRGNGQHFCEYPVVTFVLLQTHKALSILAINATARLCEVTYFYAISKGI
ncbi:hypothetical protein HDU86_004980 [Geranomyces michiganensis]|nr:hypothetical protein HDU86_004980 [Geranomyces michiganensis]